MAELGPILLDFNGKVLNDYFLVVKEIDKPGNKTGTGF